MNDKLKKVNYVVQVHYALTTPDDEMRGRATAVLTKTVAPASGGKMGHVYIPKEHIGKKVLIIIG